MAYIDDLLDKLYEFIEDKQIENHINNQNFEFLYKILKDQNVLYPSIFTYLLFASGINPLRYMTQIPEGFLDLYVIQTLENLHHIKIVFPSNIKSIDTYCISNYTPVLETVGSFLNLEVEGDESYFGPPRSNFYLYSDAMHYISNDIKFTKPVKYRFNVGDKVGIADDGKLYSGFIRQLSIAYQKSDKLEVIDAYKKQYKASDRLNSTYEVIDTELHIANPSIKLYILRNIENKNDVTIAEEGALYQVYD